MTPIVKDSLAKKKLIERSEQRVRWHPQSSKKKLIERLEQKLDNT